MSKPRAIVQFLATPGPDAIDATIERGRQLLRLWQRMQPLLDAELASHCQLLNFRNGMLIMACDSTAWATRLRYQIPTLLKMVREITGQEALQDIRIKIQPVSQKPAPQSRKPAAITSHGAYCLKQCASTITDPALRRALERLAQHQREDES